MSEYYPISLEEMRDFLVPQGFRQMEQLPNTKEIVFGKRVDADGLKLSLRVYTTITASGVREAGSDAIRIQLFWMRPSDNVIVSIAGSKKILRVKGWANNLQKRLDDWKELLPTQRCPKCQSPMVVRTNRDTKEKFLSCTGYPHCRTTKPIQGRLPLK